MPSLLKKTMLSTTLLAAMLPMSSVAAEAPLPKEQDDAHMMMDHSPASDAPATPDASGKK